jgi:N-acetylglucosaminyldiphosphoundecaprenol N-acetyl-beta-D-mannosaminyltransferase
MSDALGAIESGIRTGGFHQVATANLDFLINSIHDAELKEILAACYLVLPDGMPLLWASQMMQVPLRERVTGADLVPRLVELSARRGYRIFLLGASDAASRGAAQWMERCYPQAKLVGRYCPPFAELEDMDHEDMLLQIEAAQPDILLVAFGSPKQEKWLAMHRHRLLVPACIGVGGSLDLLAGLLPRAPQYLRDHGMEWCFRTCQEPGRLGRRYVKDAWGMIRYMTPQLAATASQKRGAAMNRIVEETIGATSILRVSGSLTGAQLPAFEDEAMLSVEEGRNLILDFTGTRYLGADALGTLLHLVNSAKGHRRELWLTGLNPAHWRLLHASQVGHCFRSAPKIADALRRIDPAQSYISIEAGKDCGLCRVDGRVIPLPDEAVFGIYREVMRMIEERPRLEFAASPGRTNSA